MYIIEKLVKLYSKFKENKKVISDYSLDKSEELEDIVTCKHNFMPIDSTGNILACSKCGYVVKKDRIKKIN